MLAFLFPATAAPPIPQPWATGTSLSVVQAPEPGEVHPPSYGIYRTCYGKTKHPSIQNMEELYPTYVGKPMVQEKSIYIYVCVDNCRYSY